MTSANETAIDLLRSLAAQEFWGNLTLKFQHGEIVHITKEESIQLNKFEPKHRRTNLESIN